MSAAVETAEPAGGRGILARVSGDYGWNVLAAAATQGCTFVASLVLANLLAAAGFGGYVAGQNAVAMLGALFALGLGFSANALLARHAGPEPGFAASVHQFCYRLSAAAGLAGGVALALGSGWAADRLFGDADLRDELLIAGVALPFFVVSSYQSGAIAGLSGFAGLARISVASGLALVAAVTWGALAGGAAGALLGLAAALVLRTGLSGWFLARLSKVRGLGTRDRDAAATWRATRGFVLPAMASSLTIGPAIWLSNAALVSAAGTAALGLFGAAFLMKTLVTFVPLQLGSVVLARLAGHAGRGDVAAWHATHRRALVGGALAASGLALPVALLASPILTLFGSGFSVGAPVLQWLMLAAVFESVATLYYYAFPGRSMMLRPLVGYFLPKDALLLGAAIVLTPEYGALGLAWAHCISWFFALVAIALLDRGASVR